MSNSAASALAAPVTMFLRNSLWPGASMMTYWRRAVRNQICAVSIVMFWSRSACKASIRLAHSKGTPRRCAMAWSCSTLPWASAPASCSSRPTNVDLPWSTWPTITIRSCSLGAVAAGGAASPVSWPLSGSAGGFKVIRHFPRRNPGPTGPPEHSAFRTPHSAFGPFVIAHIYPSRLSFSKASSLSWSWARPERSGVRVRRSSSMIWRTVRAVDLTGSVQGAQPRLR